jgi:hypothetical protein
MRYKWNSDEGNDGACHCVTVVASDFRDCHGPYKPAFVKAFPDLKFSPTLYLLFPHYDMTNASKWTDLMLGNLVPITPNQSLGQIF